MMSRTVKGYLFSILSAVVFGSLPAIAKLIYAEGLNPLSLVFFRNALAVPVLFGILRWKKISLRLTRRQAVQLCPIGLLCGLITPGLLFLSYVYISSGMATTIHFSYPVFVLLGCALFFRDRITPVRALCVLSCTAGILLFYTPGESANLFGMAIAFISGITYAAYIIVLYRSCLREISPFLFSFYMCLESAVLLLAGLLLAGQFTLPATALGWFATLGLAVAASIVGVVLFQIGVSLIGPQNASILSTFEPITSITLGVLIYREPFGLKTALGAGLILLAVTLLSLAEKRKGSPVAES